MNVEIAQMIALVCHANAFLRSLPAPQFFPGNSTCRRQEWIHFSRRTAIGEEPLAADPDEWYAELKEDGTRGLLLASQPRDSDPPFPDRITTAFAGGGSYWVITAIRRDGSRSFWARRYVLADRTRLDGKVWQTTYIQIGESPAQELAPLRLDLATARADLQRALHEILEFSIESADGRFRNYFETAIAQLGGAKLVGPDSHADLLPEGILPTEAAALLDAAQTAWVFGGMGWWNDMGFNDPDVMSKYDLVSDRLYAAVVRAVVEGTNASYQA